MAEDDIIDSMKTFEDVMAASLLIEAFNEKKAEVFENVVFEGKRRYYVENLSERDYMLENTTPYQIEFLNTVIAENAWGALLCKVAAALLSKFPQHLENITLFSCQWTKAAMFSREIKTNYKFVLENLYINCNHTALHSCWVLQDLFDYFNVDKSSVTFLIHRPCSAEPKRVTEYMENRFIKGFVDFLITHYQKSEEYGEKVANNIAKYLNPILRTVSKSYTNLFLFDDNTILSNYVKRIREKVNVSIRYNEKTRTALNKYLDYLFEYYKE